MIKKIWEHKVTHIAVILIVFSLTGTTAVEVSRLTTGWIGIEKYTWQYWIFWVFFLFPAYQVLLLFYGFLFGKYAFFRMKQKKMLAFSRRIFGFKKKESPVTEEKAEKTV